MIATLNKISREHNCCQDSLFIKENENFIFGGIFDGCSTGFNSQWASMMFAYAFKEYDIPVTDDVMYNVQGELSMLKDTFNLTFKHFLSTCILFSFRKSTQTLRIRIFGDGFFAVNGMRYTIDQQNEPDYFGYHLDDGYIAFSEYLAKYPERIFEDVEQFQICSDGIDSVEYSQFADPCDLKPLEMLLSAPTSKTHLDRMWNILKRNKFTLSDDLSIISYVHE